MTDGLIGVAVALVLWATGSLIIRCRDRNMAWVKLTTVIAMHKALRETRPDHD